MEPEEAAKHMSTSFVRARHREGWQENGDNAGRRKFISAARGDFLGRAAHKGHRLAAWLLLEMGVDKEDKDTALLVAADNGHEDIVRLLVKYGANVNAVDSDQEPVIMIACRSGHSSVLRILLESGAKTEAKNRYQETTLVIAVKEGIESMVQILLDNNANTEARSDAAKHHSSSQWRRKTFQ